VTHWYSELRITSMKYQLVEASNLLHYAFEPSPARPLMCDTLSECCATCQSSEYASLRNTYRERIITTPTIAFIVLRSERTSWAR